MRTILALIVCCLVSAPLTAPCASSRDAEIVYAEAFREGSPTGGIQEALDRCPRGTTSKNRGCEVVLPRGKVVITEPIFVGLKGGRCVERSERFCFLDSDCGIGACRGAETGYASSMSAVVLRGYGYGLETNMGDSLAGTTLIWGRDGGARVGMISLRSAQYSVLEGFALDGDGDHPTARGAERGILISSNNKGPDSGLTGQSITIRNVLFDDIVGDDGEGGIALDIDPHTDRGNDQLDAITISESAFMGNYRVGIRVAGEQTVQVVIENSRLKCRDSGRDTPETYCVEVVDGHVSLNDNTVVAGGREEAHRAQHFLYVHAEANKVSLVGNAIECLTDGACIHEDDAPGRIWETFLAGNSVQQFYSKPIARFASLSTTLVGNTFFPHGADEVSDIEIAGDRAKVYTFGNQFTSRSGLRITAPNPRTVAVVGLDNPSKSRAAMARTVLELRSAGIVFHGTAGGAPGLAWHRDGIPAAGIDLRGGAIAVTDGAMDNASVWGRIGPDGLRLRGDLRIENGEAWIELAPAAGPGGVRYRLPTEDGPPGSCLKTDGNGRLYFASCGPQTDGEPR